MPYRVCPQCRSAISSRTRRKGLMNKFVFPLFGLFPWECSDCQKVFLRRTRGKSKSAEVMGEVAQ
jgi:hypothetical protein